MTALAASLSYHTDAKRVYVDENLSVRRFIVLAAVDLIVCSRFVDLQLRST